ncbi:hypothetical protein [uncultured Legionella sp.]|uniref:hypothetical protein n=1 Tax=uncultured Legionella sp. TaxID=210934 RepID=UPI002607EE0E|nr:hypothetical protein [uncultured Legionella sp.]
MNEAIFKNHSVGSAIVELAKQGNFVAVDTYIDLAVKGFELADGSSTRGYIYYQLQDAALGAALGGHIDQMYLYIKRAKIKPDNDGVIHREYVLQGAMQGAGAVGNKKVIVSLAKKGANYKDALASAAREDRINIIKWIFPASKTVPSDYLKEAARGA